MIDVIAGSYIYEMRKKFKNGPVTKASDSKIMKQKKIFEALSLPLFLKVIDFMIDLVYVPSNSSEQPKTEKKPSLFYFRSIRNL